MNPKKLEYDYIQKLKEETTEKLGAKVEVNISENYKFRIVTRGDQLFYQQNDLALLIQMNPYDYVVYIDSINKWDNENAITKTEKELIINRIKSYFLNYHDIDVKFA